MTAPVTNNPTVMNRFSYFKNNQPGSYNQNAVLNPNISNNQISADSPLNMSPLNPYVSQKTEQIPFNGVVVDKLALHKVEYAAYAGVALSAAALLVALFNRGKVKGVSKSVKAMGEEVQKITQSNNELEEKKAIISSLIDTVHSKMKEITASLTDSQKIAAGIKQIQFDWNNSTREVTGLISTLKTVQHVLEPYKEVHYSGKAIEDKYLKDIKSQAAMRILGIEKSDQPKLDKATAWFLTAESSSTVKIGGLAEVPMGIAKSLRELTNEGIINVKTAIVTPLYEHHPATRKNGAKLKLVQEGDIYKYYTKQTGDKNPLILRKIMSLDIPVHKSRFWKSKPLDEGWRTMSPTDYFFGYDKNNEPLILIKNKDFFDITAENIDEVSVYHPNGEIDETLRFAFMSKAAYTLDCELAKLRAAGKVLLSDGRQVKVDNGIYITEEGVKMTEAELQSNKIIALESSDILFANDWHAGGMVALARYMPKLKLLEPVNDSLIKEAEKMQNKRIIYIGHNFSYQGKIDVKDEIQDEVQKNLQKEMKNDELLSLLFDEYMVSLRKIVEKPVEGLLKKYDDARIVPQKIQHLFYDDGSVSLGNMGNSLADYVVPVSEHYGDEAADHFEIGYDLLPLFNLRREKVTYGGISNALDKDGFVPEENIIYKNIIKPMKEDKDLKFDIDLKPFTKDSIEQVKPHNKNELIRFLRAVLKGEVKHPDLEVLRPDLTDLSDVTVNTPIYALVGRMEDQKGLDILKESIKKLYADLPKEDKEKKPVFIIAGQVGNGISKTLEDIKSELGDNGKHVVIIDKFIPSPAKKLFQMASDFFIVPSWFEPFGLTPLETMPSGTIPIATKTGGLATTIVDNVNGLLTTGFKYKPTELYKMKDGKYVDDYGNIVDEKDRKMTEEFKNALYENATLFAKAMKRGYDMLTAADKSQYYKIAKKGMEEDHSWIVKDARKEGDKVIKEIKERKGSIWKYIDIMNIHDKMRDGATAS